MATLRPTRAPALGDQLAAMLRERILRRHLAPETHLVEGALAQEYDVSRGPVRDALRQLEAQGLVEGRRRGYFVIGLELDDIDNLYELRESIEIVAAQRAVRRVDAQSVEHGRAIVREMLDCAERSDARTFAEADSRFHELIYQMSGNGRLHDVWRAYEPVFTSLMRLTVEEDVDLRPSAEDHGVLLDLIEAGDAERLDVQLREHLAGARARMAQAVQDLLETAQVHLA